MGIYAGLDVSDKTTHVCVVGADGGVVRRDVVTSDPKCLAKWLKRHCPGAARVVLETGPLSSFLYQGLIEREVPVICICARHAKKALSARMTKSDANDAESLAQLARTGWFKAVHMKAEGTPVDRAAEDQGAADQVAQCLRQPVGWPAQAVRTASGIPGTNSGDSIPI